jgi:hypothetical protein
MIKIVKHGGVTAILNLQPELLQHLVTLLTVALKCNVTGHNTSIFVPKILNNKETKLVTATIEGNNHD